VNYSEVLIGPLRAGGAEAAGVVDAMLARFGIETVQVDMALARRAAEIRARTSLKLPDAYALATVIHAEIRGWDDVRLETFDKALLRVQTELHPFPDG
jgi:predicted nucleic acid-binding protein